MKLSKGRSMHRDKYIYTYQYKNKIFSSMEIYKCCKYENIEIWQKKMRNCKKYIIEKKRKKKLTRYYEQKFAIICNNLDKKVCMCTIFYKLSFHS